MDSLRSHYLSIVNSLFNGYGRPFINHVINELDRLWGKANVFIIDAPTGYGKTLISLTIARYSIKEELKAVIAYPLRTLLEQQVDLFRSCLEEGVVGVRYMMNPESPYFIKPVTLTTVDTLALTSLGVAPEDLGRVMSSILNDGRDWGSMGHYVFAWASVFTSNIVLDEAHLLADSVKALAFLGFLVRQAVLHDQHLIIMTATLPSGLRDLIKDWVRDLGPGKVVSIEFSNYLQSSDSLRDDFVSERVRKDYVIEVMPVRDGDGVNEVIEWVRDSVNVISSLETPKVLAVFNTVDEAVKAYRLALRNLGIREDRVVLIHSRFSVSDREKLARRINSLSIKAKEGGEPYAVIATQAVEAGIDITSNIFVTDAAPPTTVVQRAGRFLRYEEREGKALLWWDAGDDGGLKQGPPGLYKVYDYRLVNELIKWVKSREGRVNLHLPVEVSEGKHEGLRKGYAEVLDRAYSGTYAEVKASSRRLINLMGDIVTDYMSGSRRAANLVYVLGGSLIRDSALIPVVPEVMVKGVRELKNIIRHAVPVTARSLLKLFRNGEVTAVVKGSGELGELGEGIRRSLNAALRIAGRGQAAAPKALKEIIKTLIINDVNAFVVKSEYDSREGLRIE